MRRKRIKSKLKGIRYERETKKWLEGLGYRVVRSSASLGFWDLIAFNERNVLFIQCKSTKPTKKEINKLMSVKVPSYADKYIVFPKDGNKFHFQFIPTINDNKS